MNKTVFSRLMLMLSVAVLSFSLYACGDDDNEKDEPTPPATTHPDRLAISYELSLGDAWWDFFDIEVTYTSVEGRTVTETVTRNWDYAASATYIGAASSCSFSAKATPKADQPEIDPDAVYDISHSLRFSVYALDANDKQQGLPLKTDVLSSKLTVRGNKFAELAATGRDNVVHGSWTVKDAE